MIETILQFKSQIKSNISIWHLLGAAHLARSSHEIEQKYSKPLEDEKRAEYVAYVIGAVLMSAAALESKINEIYLFAVDKNLNVFKGYELTILDILSEAWRAVNEMSILSKYQIALLLCGKKQFNKGTNPYQDADRLVRLRNALFHYKPEWDSELKTHRKLKDSLDGRFDISPFSHENDVFFPKKCLGHGCAAWAVQGTKNFINSFYIKMDLQDSGLSPYGDKLSTVSSNT